MHLIDLLWKIQYYYLPKVKIRGPWDGTMWKVQTFSELGLVILQKVLDKSAFYFPIGLLLGYPYG